jgi:hypothetical protein
METNSDLVKTHSNQQKNNIFQITNLGKYVSITIKPFREQIWLSKNYIGRIISSDSQTSTLGILFESDITYSSTNIDIDRLVSVAQTGDCIKLTNYSFENSSFRYDFTNLMVFEVDTNDEITDENQKVMNTQWDLTPKIYDLRLTLL